MLLVDSKMVLNVICIILVVLVYNEEYGLYILLLEFQKVQMNNLMVDVNLCVNIICVVNYWVFGSIYGEVDFLKYFIFKVMFFMDYVINDSWIYKLIIKVYDVIVVGNVVMFGNGKIEVSQNK